MSENVTAPSCYFCNEFLEERYLSEHVKHCGAVLTECPYKCGVYVPRKNEETHKQMCERQIFPRNTKLRLGDQDFNWKSKVFSVLTLLRSAIIDEEQNRKSLQDSLSWCFKLFDSQQESIDNLRYRVINKTEECREYSGTLSRQLASLELACDNAEQRTSKSFQKISEQLKLLQRDLFLEQNKHDQVLSDWCTELKDLKTCLAKESIEITEMWQDQHRLIHDLKLELEMRCKISKDLAARQDSIAEKIADLDAELRSQSDLLAEQTNNIKALKFQAKENLKYIEELIKDTTVVCRPVECKCVQEESWSTNGRLLWRIDRYEERMTDAKENDGPLYSQKFSNKEYGYTLRVELFLNGRGQWKGRHVIGSLRVENGKWDPLLDWPCILKATITLRNQEDPVNDIIKIVKTVGRAETDSEIFSKESATGLYMFIPHTTLTRYSGYIKKNVMFIDVRIKDIETSGSTMSLV